MRAILAATIALSTLGAPAGAAELLEVCKLEDGRSLAMRTGPTTSAPVVMQLGPGAVVAPRAAAGRRWRAISVREADGRQYGRKGPAGFVQAANLCKK